MLNHELIEKNKIRLEKEKKHLEILLGKVADPNEKVTGDFQAKYPEDMGDKPDENASEVEQYEVNVAEERDLEERLRRIEAALDRIKQGTYGVCTVGGEEIDSQRLEAVPEAETCVKHEAR